MKTVIEMAREAGLEEMWELTPRFTSRLEAFSEIVRADEREKYKWDIHSCGPTCKRYACVATREAVAAEREACAKVAENCFEGAGKHKLVIMAVEAAKAIRARGNT